MYISICYLLHALIFKLAKLAKNDNTFFIPRPTKLWWGVTALPLISGWPSICPCFISGADLGNPLGDFFDIAHTHHLGGVDVSFGVMNFDLLKLVKSAILTFNMTDI